MKIEMKGEPIYTVDEGDGPVNALDKALRKALATAHPELSQVSLCDYKVRILDSKTGTAAKTRVLIESTDGHTRWGTVGVDLNIIDASWEALRESLEFFLARQGRR